jgi:hypothetical protein
MSARASDVRFTLKSGHWIEGAECPLSAKSGPQGSLDFRLSLAASMDFSSLWSKSSASCCMKGAPVARRPASRVFRAPSPTEWVGAHLISRNHTVPCIWSRSLSGGTIHKISPAPEMQTGPVS